MLPARSAALLALVLVLPLQAAVSQVRTPVGGTRPLAPGALVPGPSVLNATSFAAGPQGGWGVRLTWAAVPNATGYRVSRTVTNSGIPAAAVNVLAIRPMALGPEQSGFNAVDATVLPNTSYTYWVEATTGPAGVLSAPSPIVAVNSGQPVQPTNLMATVSGTKLVVVQGSMARQGAIPGSDVTWTWTPPGQVYAYEVEFTILTPGTKGKGMVHERATAMTTGDPPVLAPFTWSIPQGKTVKFCVSVWANPNSEATPTTATCLETAVP